MFLRDLRAVIDRYRHSVSQAVEMTAMAEDLESEAKILRSLAKNRQSKPHHALDGEAK